MRNNISYLGNLCRRFGLKSAFLWVIVQVLHRIFYFREYVCLIIPRENFSNPEIENNFKYHELGYDFLRAHSSDPILELDSEFLAQAQSRQDRCFGVLEGLKLVSYIFVAFGPTAINDELNFKMPKNWAYFYKGFTHPKWRGKGLYILSIRAALRELSKFTDKCSGAVTLIESSNFASLTSMQKAGFEKTYKFRIFGTKSRPQSSFISSSSPEGFSIEKLSN